MAHPNRDRARFDVHVRLLAARGGLTLLLPVAVSIGACGGGAKPAESPPNASESSMASASESSSSSASSSGASNGAVDSGAASAPAETASAPPANTGSTKATAKTDPAWAACHQSFKPKGKDVSKDVATLSRSCAKAMKMKQIGKAITGKQSDSGPPQTFPLKAAANHCYRVYAQGGDGIKNLDVAIKDSTGAVAGQDSTDSATAVALDDGAVCFKEADAANVVVSVGSGSGPFALQIWGD